jgi:selenocysteine lyase/cysteine desulfurase
MGEATATSALPRGGRRGRRPGARDLPGLEGALTSFLDDHPGYARTGALDELRCREFARLDAGGDVYLDYTGGGLYPASLVRRHGDDLLARVYGNPHSTNPTSRASAERVEATRRHVLAFFGASPEEYAVVFTANASHALKLVGESYPFEPGDRFLLTFDNHNSVNGIREFDRARGAQTLYVPVVPPELRVDGEVLEEYLDRARPEGHNLFAYPAQSNFSGVQHPLEWIAWAQARGWDVLLDAAAFVPTQRLDLSRWHPDYVALSFYKMFGYPTGVGALIARRQALAKLHRPWFAGGTITVASVQADRHRLAPGEAAFEDGTLDYLNIPAVDHGLTLLESVGLDTIGQRVGCLTAWLLETLVWLRHGNGEHLAQLYGPATLEGRGATVAFNLLDAQGRLVDHRRVEEAANRHRISLRTGCFCNPGAGEVALGYDPGTLTGCFDRPEASASYEAFRECVDPTGAGAVRVSLGMASSFADVYALVALLREFLED